jgi:hypothetical protein
VMSCEDRHPDPVDLSRRFHSNRHGLRMYRGRYRRSASIENLGRGHPGTPAAVLLDTGRPAAHVDRRILHERRARLSRLSARG